MSKELLWISDLESLRNISIESYQFTIEQAKERLDEVINESRLITSSGMKVLMVYVAALPGLAGYIFSEHKNFKIDFITFFVIILFAALAIYIFTLLISLIAYGRRNFKGSEPKDIFREEYLIDLDPNTGFKKLLLTEIIRVQNKIERIHKETDKQVQICYEGIPGISGSYCIRPGQRNLYRGDQIVVRGSSNITGPRGV